MTELSGVLCAVLGLFDTGWGVGGLRD